MLIGILPFRACTSPRNYVQLCRISLEEIARHSHVTFMLVPGHRDKTQNCKADELTYFGTKLNFYDSQLFIDIAMTRKD